MSEYIMDLRKLLGNRPLMQAGASVMVVDSQDRVLLENAGITAFGRMPEVPWSCMNPWKTPLAGNCWRKPDL